MFGLVTGMMAGLYAGDPMVPGWTSIANTTGAFGDTTQEPSLIDQFTLAEGTGASSGTAVTVSPVGFNTKTAGVTVPNNGAAFGPDTPGTITCGIQEALNSLPAITFPGSKSGDLTQSLTGRSGNVQLLNGVFAWGGTANTGITGLITIPRGVVRFRGRGWSSYQPALTYNIPATTDIGGTQIVAASSLTNTGVITMQLTSDSLPATTLDFGDMDVRLISASPSSPPAMVQTPGFVDGIISNLRAYEVASATMAVVNNLTNVLDFSMGPNCDYGVIMNVMGFGGGTSGGVALKLNSRPHTFAYNLFGGFNSGPYAQCVQIGNELDFWVGNVHCFSGNYGLGIEPMTAASPLVIHGVHFESLTHYLIGAANSLTGMVIIDNPHWDVGSLTPTTDIAASLALGSNTYSLSASTGIALITANEDDVAVVYGASAHVTVPKGAITAGSSPATLPVQPFDCVYVLTGLGGGTISGITLDGTGLGSAQYVVATASPIYVKAQHALIVTYTGGTGPVFECFPQ